MKHNQVHTKHVKAVDLDKYKEVYEAPELTIGTSSGGLSPRIALIRLKREWEGAFCIKTTSKDLMRETSHE
jgi:hypothetical protein